MTDKIERPAKKSFKDWYADNKADLSAKRKARYHSDPEYRAKVKESALEARRKNPRVSTAGKSLFKQYKGQQIRVYRVGDVSALIGRKEQVIRQWERNGWIPKPIIGGVTHRYYTEDQVKLLREFAELIDQVRYSPLSRNLAINTKSVEVWSKWGTEDENDSK